MFLIIWELNIHFIVINKHIFDKSLWFVYFEVFIFTNFMVFPVDYFTRWKLNNKYINYNNKKHKNVVIWYYNPKAFKKLFAFGLNVMSVEAIKIQLKKWLNILFVQSIVIFLPFMIFNKIKKNQNQTVLLPFCFPFET